MDKYLALLVCLTTGTTTAQYRYPRPSKPFGTTSTSVSVLTTPAPTYGVPDQPSSTYGVPSRPTTGRRTTPSNTYGVPSPGQTRPTSSYGVPGSSYYQEGYDYDEPANYQFQYDVDAPDYGTNFGHQESRQGDVARGEYYVLLPDGRTQRVSYVADRDGYRPTITYEGGGRGGFGSY